MESKLKGSFKEYLNLMVPYLLNGKLNVFSSPEPKAQVSFSDKNLSVVRRCHRCLCCRCRRCRRKLFTFSSSSPEPLDQFQPNLAQSILGVKGIYIWSKEGPRPFPRG